MHRPLFTLARCSLLAGPAALLLTLLLDAPAGMSAPAWHTTGLALWMAIWWIAEVVDIPVTALLPLIAAPLLGLSSLSAASQPYAHPLIFLFLGGFVLSIAMERWNLHRRIALHTMLLVGSKPSQQIGGVMLVTAFLSMWMSNTATAVMMLPIALSVIRMVTAADATAISTGFDKALLLSIAYAASIGGLATLIGTPPNALLAAYLSDTYQINIGFAQWMALGVPLALLLLGFSWLWLTRISFPVDRAGGVCSKAAFRQQLSGLGPMQAPEKTVLVVFVLTALSWTFRPLLERGSGLPLDDTMIAIMAAAALFILPAAGAGQRILRWEDTGKLPWGVLLLFGGGLSLAGLMLNLVSIVLISLLTLRSEERRVWK
jgi:sodium-dependent dicarboxylate transporter 2/3/5